MRKDQASLTAVGIAIARAVESEKPEPERICFDPYARKFVPAWMYFLMSFFIRSGYTDWRGPGINGYLVARDRYMDDVLKLYLENNLEQLVLLGAGFDSRAYRFEVAGRIKIFEVDHPTTQLEKLARLKAIFGNIPDHVCYVPVDFNTQTLSSSLLDAGYDPRQKTLFIWEGVTMYLTSETVDSTLKFIVENSAPGSAVLFDYIDEGFLNGNRQPAEIKNMRRYRFLTGEDLTFGISPDCIETFLIQRGFLQVQNVQSQDLKQRYFSGVNSRRSVAGGYGIAIGIVSSDKSER
jgi:methyltransferase (TIGR00027 family)